MTRKNTHMIEETRQLKEIVRSVRNEIRMAFEGLGEATIAELGSHLGCSPESLYYHIRRLQKVGLVEQVGVRSGKGPNEAVYRLCARRIRVNTQIRKPSFVKSLLQGVRTMLRYAERCYTHALEKGTTVLKGEVRECRMIQITKRLTEKQIVELNQRLLQLESDIEKMETPSGERQFLITLVLSPTQRN